MKAQDLIKELQKHPNAEVCIVDWNKNIFNADDEPQGEGIEPDFKVEYLDDFDGMTVPIIALSFENNDYNDDGTPNAGSLLYAQIKNENL